MNNAFDYDTADELLSPCEENGHEYETDPENISYHECTGCGDSYRD
jgi:hypothetical protein